MEEDQPRVFWIGSGVTARNESEAALKFIHWLQQYLVNPQLGPDSLEWESEELYDSEDL